MSEEIDFVRAKNARDRARLADAVLAEIEAPDEIRGAIVDSLARQNAYLSLARDHAAEDERDGIPAAQCCNAVCPKNRDRRCSGGAEDAQTCVFRMAEEPPSDPFRRLPSHAEALRMLMRAGLLKPDDFGHWNGTDFAQRAATRHLWFAFVDMLIASGKVAATDRGEASEQALAYLGLPRHREPLQDPDDAPRCSKPGCPYDAVFTVPDLVCEWHWHLWFAYGNETLALEDMRARRSDGGRAGLGHQRPITYLDRIGNDADRRYATDMANCTHPLDVEVRSFALDGPSLSVVRDD